MRIIGGKWGGRSLAAPTGRGTRPTTDRVREALFSVLNAQDLLRGARVLDLYAGTGALMLEAISRGALGAVAVESDRRACRVLQANVVALGAEDDVLVLACRVERALAKLMVGKPFDLMFVDPPYARLAAPDFVPLLEKVSDAVLNPGGVLVLEHAHRDQPPELTSHTQAPSRRYGDTALTLYHRDSARSSCPEAPDK